MGSPVLKSLPTAHSTTKKRGPLLALQSQGESTSWSTDPATAPTTPRNPSPGTSRGSDGAPGSSFTSLPLTVSPSPRAAELSGKRTSPSTRIALLMEESDE